MLHGYLMRYSSASSGISQDSQANNSQTHLSKEDLGLNIKRKLPRESREYETSCKNLE